jgi:hypothetical protein
VAIICNRHQSSRDGYGMVRRAPNQLGVMPFVCAYALCVDFVQRQKERGKWGRIGRTRLAHTPQQLTGSLMSVWLIPTVGWAAVMGIAFL